MSNPQSDPAAEMLKVSLEHTNARDAAFEDQLFAIATGEIDRAKNAVTVLQGAATALLAIYTGLLGFIYSATGEALPFRGIITPIFLGLAVLMSTWYTSFVAPRVGEATNTKLPTADTPDRRLAERVNALVDYAGSITKARAWALRAAVVALAVGLVAIALPFIAEPKSSETEEAGAAEWIPVVLPTELPPSDWPVELAAVFFQAQLADASAQAEAAREAAAKDVAAEADESTENTTPWWSAFTQIGSESFTWGFIVAGLGLVFLTALLSWIAGRRSS